jgi:hypothetical protein
MGRAVRFQDPNRKQGRMWTTKTENLQIFASLRLRAFALNGFWLRLRCPRYFVVDISVAVSVAVSGALFQVISDVIQYANTMPQLLTDRS